MEKFKKISFLPADVLIPRPGTDMSKWSVVACDQFTSQPDYWDKVKQIAADSPSAYHIIFPEVYLEKGSADERIKKINKTMSDYIKSGIFTKLESSFVYVERKLPGGSMRRGLVGAIDLEAYDYKPGSKSLIRATEKTVLERIPPRVKIRINAPLELPHAMLLIDDERKEIIERLSSQKSKFKVVYDFELMQNGGHITGYHISKEDAGEIAEGLYTLMKNKDFLYAVGDGNHSLAAAKECWEQKKKTLSADEAKHHKARYALVELVNIHDDSLVFEPIHRVVFGCEPESLIKELDDYCSKLTGDEKTIKYVYGGKEMELSIKTPPGELALSCLQSFLDLYVSNHNCKIDYIHGKDVVLRLASSAGNIGFTLPAMQKCELFPAVSAGGALPRKTFSMGEANEKRYYLECREI